MISRPTPDRVHPLPRFQGPSGSKSATSQGADDQDVLRIRLYPKDEQALQPPSVRFRQRTEWS
jgi:hypothetical protein